MASARATFAFPLLSLPAKHQLLVISLKNNKTDAEQIYLFPLLPQQGDHTKGKTANSITLPSKKAIKAILPAANALAQFQRVFNKETKDKYRDFPLRMQVIKAFDRACNLCTTYQEIRTHICHLSKTSAIHLLNVKAFETLFTQVSIDEITQQHMQNKTFAKSLHDAAEFLHDQILSTDVAVYEVLDQMAISKASKLQWCINNLQMKYDIEKTTRMHALRIFQEATRGPNQVPKLKKYTKQLLKDHENDAENKKAPSAQNHYHFISRCFLPSFDPHQEILSLEIKDRIYNLDSFHSQMTSLRNFCLTLNIKFSDQLYCSTSDEEE